MSDLDKLAKMSADIAVVTLLVQLLYKENYKNRTDGAGDLEDLHQSLSILLSEVNLQSGHREVENHAVDFVLQSLDEILGGIREMVKGSRSENT